MIPADLASLRLAFYRISFYPEIILFLGDIIPLCRGHHKGYNATSKCKHLRYASTKDRSY